MSAIRTVGLTKRYGETLALSPFHEVGLIPAEAFNTGAAIAMLAIALLAAIVSVRLFEHRDLVGE